MMIEPLALGVIGLGRAGMMHLKNLLNEPSVKVVAVADANLAQLSLPEQLQAKVYDDASDLLANPQVKAVCIFAPTNAHEGLVRAAANAGKHIFFVKNR
ncbi:Gfo/Idh/MocA family protein [Lacticaseibacillus nasuensis]|uniref:Gfo/Idh/MocA family protein n=1 Tax=Lacticaseibacillus nasuensis TaxID=944671 RepID=UPI000B04ABD4|nr:Gfo/Idh/MocA family oxidoreductase [Lacticaseibacillus nasuensis]